MAHLLSVDAAQARLLALATPLPCERLPIAETQGRYLTEPLRAHRTQPAADLSAMDGYAVLADNLSGPWQVVGESAAGHPFAGRLGRGQAVRMSTGALLPNGVGTVLIQEDCAREGEQLHFIGSLPSPIDRHIRRKAMDFSDGHDLLPGGTHIGPPQIALAILAGHGHLPVCRPPHIAVIDGGDELVEPGEPCPPHRLPAGNGSMLAALARTIPCRITRIGPISDDLPAVVEALDQARDADVIVTSGGASVGDHDLVGPALRAWGATIDVWKVALKPGKPLMIARRGHQIVLGLPGNPVSSLVTAYLFLLPLLRALLGASHCLPRPLIAQSTTPLGPTGDRREYLRARWDGQAITLGENHDSGALASLAVCNTLIDRPPHSPALAAGGLVQAYLLDASGIA